MSLTTKLSLSNAKVLQGVGDTLNLSGTTIINGILEYDGLKNFTNKYQVVDKNYVTGLTSVLGIQTANNGLSKTGLNVHLGGALTGNTTIGIGSCILSVDVNSFNITAPIKICTTPITGLNTDGVLVWNSVDKCVKQINVVDVLSSGITGATNGLTKIGQRVKLGGTLTGSTTIDGSTGAYDFSLTNLNSFALGFDNVSTITDSGTNGGLRNAADYGANFVNESLVTKRYVTGITSGLGVQTANNGLTKSGLNVHLGGVLTGNTTITGSNTLSIMSPSSLDNNEYIRFCKTPPSRGFCEGSLYYKNNKLNFDRDISGVTLQIGEEMVVAVCNISAGIITNGSVVYICGGQSGLPTIAKSIASNQVQSDNTIGIVTDDIGINGKGYVTSMGLVNGLNTSLWAEGTALFLSSTQAGCFTCVPPQYPNDALLVGYVTCQDSSIGSVLSMMRMDTDYVTPGIFTGYTASTSCLIATKMSCLDFDSYTGNTTPIINGLVSMCACAVTGATNGLSKSGSHNVCLGGTLSSPVTICGVNTFKVGDVCGITLSTYNTTDIGLNAKSNGGIYLKSQSGVVDSVSDFTGAIGIGADYNAASGFAIYDNRLTTDQTGIVYAGNYSCNYVNRSLVDKQYVDSVATGLNTHASVFATTTGNTSLSGVTTIDGVVTTTGMRILVKNQLAGWQNGIYSASTGTWGRTADYNFNPSGEISNGDIIPVLSGITQANSIWILTTPNPVVSGDSLSFSIFLQQISVREGNGIVITNVGISKQIAVRLSPTACGLQFNGTGLEQDWNTYRVGLTCVAGGKVDVRASKCVASGNEIPLAINTGGTNVLYVDSSTVATCMGTPIICANNGLTKSGANIHLGGTLTGNTTINGSTGTYDLSLTGMKCFALGFSNVSTITDSGANGGLRYAADYSTNYNTRSLVDKEYVDCRVVSGVYACNGLTKVGGTVILGGQLTGNTQVWLGSGRLCFKDGGTSCIDLISTCSNVRIQDGLAYMQACTSSSCVAKVCVTSGGTVSVSSNATNCGVQITSPSTGAIYAADYSAGFINRSLVDKAYVTGITSGLGIQTANNGLTKSGLNVHLGGALTGNTAITGAYTLSVCGGAQLNTTLGYKISGSTILRTSPNSISTVLIGCCAGNNTNTSNNSVAVGYQALYSLTNGHNNTALGYQALYSNTFGGCNVAIGNTALYSNTCGHNNIAIGLNALANNTSGCNNIGDGYQALCANTTGNNNTASGYYALAANETGCNNIASGQNALRSNTTGCNNNASGNNVLRSNTTGCNNIGNGNAALYSNTSGYDNTASGYGVLFNNLTGCNNIGNGYCALYGNTTGSNNAANGYRALSSNISGWNNTASGLYALAKNTTGNNNNANGCQALCNNTIGCNNTASGSYALYTNTTGCDNIANGYQALNQNIGGRNNIANGCQALYSNTGGTDNIASGYQALYGNTSGVNNVANGCKSLYSNTTGNNNNANGFESLCANTLGSNNIAFGYRALMANITGSDNIALGSDALLCNKGIRNIGIGSNALYYNSGGTNNIGIGYCALGFNTSGYNNVGYGSLALQTNTTGCNNVAIGYGSLYSNSTGCNNVTIGYCAGYGETTSNKLYISNSSTTQPLIYGDFSSKCVIVHGAFKTSGTTSLLVAPNIGTISDQVLVRNSGTGEIKTVAGASLGDKNNIYAKTTVTGSTLLTTGSTYVILVNHSAPATITLPASPIDGQVFRIKDAAYIALSVPITIGRNGKNVDRQAADALINTDAGALELVYDATLGWFSFSFIN